MSTLRAKTIRLAHSRPDLRPHLLPLLSRVAAKKPNLDPNMILKALSDIAKDPEKYGVEDSDTLDELSRQVRKLMTEFARGESKLKTRNKKASVLSSALRLAAIGFDTVGSAVAAGRHVASKHPKLKESYDEVLKNTLGVAYSALCLGTAAALSTIAPNHPIAQHASDYESAMSNVEENISALEKMRDKTKAVVESMSDDEVEVSINMMRKAVKAVTNSKALPEVDQETIEASVKIHNSLQDLFGEFTGIKVKKPGHGAKRTYKEYAEEKKGKGERPMDREQWEARFGE